MTPSNLSLLGVTIPRQLFTLRREAELCSIDYIYKIKGESFIYKYWFIRYGKLLPAKEVDRGAIPELLNLCPSNLPAFSEKPQRVIADGITTEKKVQLEGIAERPEIDKKELTRFLNRLGVLGLDTPLRGSVGRIMGVSDLWTWFRIGQALTKKIWKDKEALKEFEKHRFEILKGNEIPLYIIEETLRELARIARLTIAIKESQETRGDRYAKRIVTAWDQVIPVPDTGKAKDPASPKYDKSKAWKSKVLGLPILHPENVSRVFDNFALQLNLYLKPFSSLVVTTERIQNYKAQGFGLEVTFSAHCLNALRDENKVVKRCVICSLPFIPTRNKEEGVYCRRCKNAEAQRKNRQRKKKK